MPLTCKFCGRRVNKCWTWLGYEKPDGTYVDCQYAIADYASSLDEEGRKQFYEQRTTAFAMAMAARRLWANAF